MAVSGGGGAGIRGERSGHRQLTHNVDLLVDTRGSGVCKLLHCTDCMATADIVYYCSPRRLLYAYSILSLPPSTLSSLTTRTPDSLYRFFYVTEVFPVFSFIRFRPHRYAKDKMRPVATGVPWSLSLSLSLCVCVSVSVSVCLCGCS